MQGIYSFIKNKAKEKGVRIEDLHKQCNISRTTMYRIIKGVTIPSSEIIDKLAGALKLSGTEKGELQYCYKIAELDPNQYQSRMELEKFIYQPEKETIPKVDFIFYDKRKYVMSFKEILESISELSSADDFACQIKIMNCTELFSTTPLLDFIRSTKLNNFYVEQLVRFSDDDHHENILVLKSIVRLLRYDFYNVYFANYEGALYTKNSYQDYMLISCTANKEEKYMFMTFTDSVYSDCYSFSEPYLYEFFDRQYEYCKNDYQTALATARSINFLSEYNLQLEEENDLYLFKPNPCYNRIPIDVYKSIASRLTNDNKNTLLIFCDRPSGKYNEADSIIDTLICQLENRIEASYKNKQTDIYTQPGLEQFAKDGKLSDHFDFLPCFSKVERKLILETIRDRGKNQNDSFSYYIVPAQMAHQIIFSVNSGGGIAIEYTDCVYGNCYIEQKSLANVFIDFAENHVPNMLAISDADAEAFINHLIETYCN